MRTRVHSAGQTSGPLARKESKSPIGRADLFTESTARVRMGNNCLLLFPTEPSRWHLLASNQQAEFGQKTSHARSNTGRASATLLTHSSRRFPPDGRWSLPKQCAARDSRGSCRKGRFGQPHRDRGWVYPGCSRLASSGLRRLHLRSS